MRLRALVLTMTFGGAALTNTTVQAQSVDPCSVYTCMAGISGVGTTGGPACAPSTELFFSIAIFDPYFDAPATATARREYLMTCPGANVATNAAILEAIIAEWGYVP